MGGTPKLDKCDRVLVVEGYGDLLFYAEMLEAVGRLEGVFIKDMGGKGELVTKLETFLRPDLLASKGAVAVLVDGDDNPAGTVASLERRLSEMTGQTVTAGAWTDGKPRVGLFVAPGDGQAGEIETLVWETWAADPANAVARQCIETYESCMAAAGQRAKSRYKGLIGALLAIRSDEDPRLGPGARDRVFDLAAPGFGPLREFLSEL